MRTTRFTAPRLLLGVLVGCLGQAICLAAPREAGLTFDRIEDDRGLSQKSILAVAQDRQGFMWFGSYDGLNRYDGYRFKTFRHNARNSNTLSNNWVNALCVDRQGTLWIGTEGGGLNAFDPQTATFRRFSHRPGDPSSLADNRVFCILEDTERGLWVGTAKGLDRLNAAGTVIEHFNGGIDAPCSLSDASVYCLYRDRRGDLWAGTSWGLNRFDPHHRRFQRFIPAPTGSKGRRSPNFVTCLYEDRKGAFWVGTEAGLYCLDRRSGAFLPLPGDLAPLCARQSVAAVLEDPDGTLVIGTTGTGLVFWETETERASIAKHVPKEESSLPFDIISSLYLDRSQILWVGTMNGLCSLSGRQKNFHFISGNIAQLQGSGSLFAMAVVEGAQEEVWIGSLAEGLLRFDSKTGTLQPCPLSRDETANEEKLGVWALLLDGSGTLWVGTYGKGLWFVDPASRRLRPCPAKSQPGAALTGYEVRTLFEDRESNFWVGTDKGLLRFDRAAGTFTRCWPAEDAGEEERGGVVVRAVVQDLNGTLWIGLYGGGLVHLDPRTGLFSRLRCDESRAVGLSSDFVRCLHLDGRGFLWVGTDQGLNRYDPKRGGWKLYSTENGLPSDVVYGIVPDDQGRFWLSTNLGLSCFDPVQASFWNFDRRDGLQSNEFNQGAFFRGRSGNFYFGGLNGVTYFKPETILPNRVIPPIYITDLRIFDRSVNEGAPPRLTRQVPNLGDITLDYPENVLTFEFVALNYQNAARNEYAYKLEGVDQDWIRAGKRRYATYGNLGPGRYVFRVKGANNDGVWNEKGAMLAFTIVPPWWLTWWAFAGYVVLGIGVMTLVAGLGIRSRLRRVEREYLRHSVQRLREVDAMKTEFLNIASHELRTPLTSVVGFTRMIQRKLEDVILPAVPRFDSRQAKAIEQVRGNMEIIVSEAERLTVLINDLLDISKLEAGKIEWKQEPVDIEKTLAQGRETLRPLADPKGLEIVTAVENGIPLVSGDPDRLVQVIINLFSNAVKFTEKGYIVGEAKRCGDAVFVSVRDTGVGIAAEHVETVFEKFRQVGDSMTDRPKGTGLGLSICRQIIEQHGGHIWVESEPGQGSTFTFSLPIHRGTDQRSEKSTGGR